MCWGKLGGGAPTVPQPCPRVWGCGSQGLGGAARGRLWGPCSQTCGPESIPSGQCCLSCLVLRKDTESRKLRSLGQACCCPGEGLSLRVRAGALLLGRREVKAQEGSGLAQVGRASAGQKVTRARRAEGKQSGGCWAGALTQRGALAPPHSARPLDTWCLGEPFGGLRAAPLIRPPCRMGLPLQSSQQRSGSR